MLVSASLLPGIVKLDNVGKCQFDFSIVRLYISLMSFWQSDQFNYGKDIGANLVTLLK